MPFYERGDVRIRYEEAGSGFPLLVTPGGGLNSRVSNWPTAEVINRPRIDAIRSEHIAYLGHERNCAPNLVAFVAAACARQPSAAIVPTR